MHTLDKLITNRPALNGAQSHESDFYDERLDEWLDVNLDDNRTVDADCACVRHG